MNAICCTAAAITWHVMSAYRAFKAAIKGAPSKEREEDFWMLVHIAGPGAITIAVHPEDCATHL